MRLFKKNKAKLTERGRRPNSCLSPIAGLRINSVVLALLALILDFVLLIFAPRAMRPCLLPEPTSAAYMHAASASHFISLSLARGDRDLRGIETKLSSYGVFIECAATPIFNSVSPGSRVATTVRGLSSILFTRALQKWLEKRGWHVQLLLRRGDKGYGLRAERDVVTTDAERAEILTASYELMKLTELPSQ